ncbi:hypothetical protein [Nocardia sp. CA-290969]|uniref:hypothetical protein n=1 Tax=Nocardia sp. CA-290969 TaxID=3239986 RepID=UPI003D9364BE
MDRPERETLMGNEAPDRPAAGPADEPIGDRSTTTVSSFVAEQRERGVDPALLLDTDFLLGGAE